MQDNPFSGMINFITNQAKGQIPQWIRFGKVIGADPLKVEIAGTIQAGNDLLKNAGLGGLESGDIVLAIPIDNNQKFIVLCKVVSV